MFVYSIRSSTVKFFGVLLVAILAIIGIVFAGDGGAVSASSTVTGIDYSGIKSAEERIAFIEQFGIEVDKASEKEEGFKMPDNFDRVILGYNELQKKQGLDLSKYAKKRVTRYTYRVTNYNSDGDVYANLFIYRGRIVACDISSADPEGFVMPLTLVEKDNLK